MKKGEACEIEEARHSQATVKPLGGKPVLIIENYQQWLARTDNKADERGAKQAHSTIGSTNSNNESRDVNRRVANEMAAKSAASRQCGS